MSLLVASSLLSLQIRSVHPVQWSEEGLLTQHPSPDWYPAILKLSSGEVWLVWASGRSGSFDIYVRTYDGSAWSPPTILVSNPSLDSRPAISQGPDGRVWLLWQSSRSGNPDIYYKVLTGSEWSAETPLTSDPSADLNPSVVATKSGEVWAIWQSLRTGDSELFYRVFRDGIWADEVRLTSDPGQDAFPSITQDNAGRILVAWITTRTGDQEIFFKEFEGQWSAETQLTSSNALESTPSIVVMNDNSFWIVWSNLSPSPTNPEGDLWYTVSFDGGSSWIPSARLTSGPDDDAQPSLAKIAPGTILAVWSSDRTGNYEVHSARILITDISVLQVNPRYSIVFPGEELNFSVTLENQGWKTETFILAAEANSTLVANAEGSITPSSTSIVNLTWNTTASPRGTYMLKASVFPVLGEDDTLDNSILVKVVLTITGDLNGDLRVNILDLVMVGSTFGARAGDPAYNPLADPNRDGQVNILDLVIVGSNFGRTV